MAGLLGVPVAGLAGNDPAGTTDSASGAGTPAFTRAAAVAAGGPLDLIARGLVAGDDDVHAAANTAVWEQATGEAASTRGSVYLPGADTYRFTGPIHLDDNVQYFSDGATLKLASGANGNLVQTRGFGTLWAGDRKEGPTRWVLAGFVLDGNAAAQTVDCHPLSIYGSDFTIDHVRITNGSGGGLRSGWGADGTKMEARLRNVTVHNNHKLQFDWRGPHDSQMSDIIVFTDFAFHKGAKVPGSRGIKFSGRDGGTQVDRMHVWGFHERAVEFAASGTLVYNGVAEGAQVNVWFNANGCVFDGHVFGSAMYGGGNPYSGTEVGCRIGTADSGKTQWQNRIVGKLSSWNIGDRAIDLAADNGTHIDVTVHNYFAKGVVSGIRSFKSTISVNCVDHPEYSERPGGFNGTGTPHPTLGVVGSLYTRLDGQAGSFLYRKSAPNTWTAML
jgi:hypothetical protein